MEEQQAGFEGLDDIKIEDLKVEPVDKLKGDFRVEDIRILAPNENGHQQMFISLLGPTNASEPTNVEVKVFINRAWSAMSKDEKKQNLTPGQIGWYARNTRLASNLVTESGASRLNDVIGRTVGASVKPEKDDPSRYEVTAFYKPKD